jgi:hypothetical protein
MGFGRQLDQWSCGVGRAFHQSRGNAQASDAEAKNRLLQGEAGLERAAGVFLK